jgi:Zn-dependent protease with chaperone function
MTSDDMLMMAGVALVGGVPCILVLLLFTFGTQRDVIELYESRLRLIGVIALAATVIALNMAMAVQLLHAYWVTGNGSDLLLGLALLGPFGLALLSYLTLDWRYARAYGQWLPCESLPDYATVATAVDDLSARMGLEATPRILISPRQGMSPFCFGRSSRSLAIVLPADFSDHMRTACGKSPAASASLTRFVIGHELAHAKNGDCVLMAWVAVFLRDLGPLTVGLAALVAVLFLLGQTGPLYAALLLASVVSVLGTVLLSAIASSASRHRELLADARASLYISHAEIAELLGAKAGAQDPSPLARFVTYLSLASAAVVPTENLLARGWRTLPFGGALAWAAHPRFASLPGWIGRPLQFVFGDHPPLLRRMECLGTRAYLEDHPPYPSWSDALQIHLVAGFASMVVAVTGAALSCPATADGKDMSGNLLQVQVLIVLFLCFVYPSIALSLAGRGVEIHKKLSVVVIARLLRNHFIGIACAWAGIAVLAAAVWLLATLSRYGLSASQLRVLALAAILQCLSVVFAAVLGTFISSTRLKGTFGQRVLNLNRLQWVPALAVSGALLALLFVVYHPFVALGALVSGLAIALTCIPRLLPMGDASFNLLVIRLPGRWLIADGGRFWIRSNLLMTLVVFLVIVIPANVAAPVMQWTYSQTCDAGQEVFFLLGVLAVCIASLLFIPGSGRDRASLSFTFVVLWRLLSMRMATSLVPAQTCLGTLERWLKETQTREGGYSTRVKGSLCSMDMTYYAAVCWHALHPGSEESKRMVQWIRRCRHPAGGYGPWPGGRPRFATTCSALSALDLLGHRAGEDERQSTARWLTSFPTKRGFLVGPYSSRLPVEETFYAVRALNKLGSLELLDRQAAAISLKALLEKRDLTIEEAYYGVESLHTIGELDATTRRKICERIVRPWLPAVGSIPIGPNVLTVGAFIDVAARVLDGGAAELQELLPSLGARVKETFEKTLTSAAGPRR